MKVKIGPYTTWVGAFQIADLLQHVGVSEDRCYKIGEWLAETWVHDVCMWIESKKKRKVKIQIDKYDTWSMDHTLALITLPMLKQLQKTKHGSQIVDNEDVPEELHSTPTEQTWLSPDDYDEGNLHKRWDWVMDELIWTFEQLASDNCDDTYDVAYHERISNGLRLFGKYYRGLWD